MRFRWSAPVALLALLALLAVAVSAAAGAGTAPRDARKDAGQTRGHDQPGPLTKDFEARREAGLELKLRGEARGKVARLGKNKYVGLVCENERPFH